MATFDDTAADRTTSQATQTRRPRWRRRLLWLAALVLLGVAAFYWRPLQASVSTATAYGARVGCSCRYVGGRPLGDCRKDFEPGMSLVMLSEDEAARSVTARVPLLGHQTATYHDGPGCQLEPWRD